MNKRLSYQDIMRSEKPKGQIMKMDDRTSKRYRSHTQTSRKSFFPLKTRSSDRHSNSEKQKTYLFIYAILILCIYPINASADSRCSPLATAAASINNNCNLKADPALDATAQVHLNDLELTQTPQKRLAKLRGKSSDNLVFMSNG